MNDNHFQNQDKDEIFSKSLRAGKRTYFFDVRETRAGDYYLTITESKKLQQDEDNVFYKKHKIYLYKEDFEKFTESLEECTAFITKTKGMEVISERHRHSEHSNQPESNDSSSNYSDVNFEDI